MTFSANDVISNVVASIFKFCSPEITSGSCDALQLEAARRRVNSSTLFSAKFVLHMRTKLLFPSFLSKSWHHHLDSATQISWTRTIIRRLTTVRVRLWKSRRCCYSTSLEKHAYTHTSINQSINQPVYSYGNSEAGLKTRLGRVVCQQIFVTSWRLWLTVCLLPIWYCTSHV